MNNALDVDLEDHEQVDEIELLSELMAFASNAVGRLDRSAVDVILGLA